jgi:hypothetical protein
MGGQAPFSVLSFYSFFYEKSKAENSAFRVVD